MTTTNSPIWPAVILRHTLPDGSAHFDLLLDAAGGPDGLLTTLRCSARPDEPGTWTAEQTPDHRRIYLSYQGPVSGDRGEVRRVWSGSATVEKGGLDRETVGLVLRNAAGSSQLLGQTHQDGKGGRQWRFITEVAAGR